MIIIDPQQRPSFIRSGYFHLAVLTLSMISALVQILLDPLPFTLQHGLALLLLVICWYGRRNERLWWKPILLATLIAATFYVAMFGAGNVIVNSSLSHGISGFRFTLGLHPLFLILTLHALWVWSDDVRTWISPPRTQEEVERGRLARVNTFVRHFQGKSTAELQMALRDPQALVPEARVAAERILAERLKDPV